MTAEPTTSGVDSTRPPVDPAAAVTRSLLANGPYGWIQVANFILTGLMVIAVAALTHHHPPTVAQGANQ